GGAERRGGDPDDGERQGKLAAGGQHRHGDLGQRSHLDLAGNRTTAAHAAIATDNTPPSGKPTSTLSREVPRSLTVHFSSTAPEEKKNTSYGVIAAPNNAIA